MCLRCPHGVTILSRHTYDAVPRYVFEQCFSTHFNSTGKERDAESGLDYFGARYYASAMGRWMSPDWSAKEEPVPYARLDDPQSLNLYGYVGNNPLSRADADGHCDADGSNCSAWDQIAGAVGGALNIIPTALNLPVKGFNAVSGHFGGPQLDEFQTIQPDAHASSTGITTGTVASFAIPIGGEAREGTWLLGQIGSIESRVGNILTKTLTADTLSAATREVNGGMSVAKEGGGLFSHVTKVEQGINGLNRQLTHAEGLLKPWPERRGWRSFAESNRQNKRRSL